MTVLSRVTELAQDAIRSRVTPGGVIGIVTKSGGREVVPFGRLRYEDDSPRVLADTIYDVASITKSVPTASLALMQIEKGKLGLDDLVSRYLPKFKNGNGAATTIRHLLTHTVGHAGSLAALARTIKGAQELIDHVLTTPFVSSPGERFVYTNTPTFLLGLLLERLYKEPLDTAAEHDLFGPLGMARTTYDPSRFPQNEVAPTEIDAWRGLVQGVVHDESAYVCMREGKSMGHAGLFSTAPDMLIFIEMLLGEGEYGGRRYFSPETVRLMRENQIPHLRETTGLGFEVNQPHFMGANRTAQSFGKTGFTGTSFVCDIEKGMGFTILTNRTYPQRPQDGKAINALRVRIADVILES